MKFFTIVLLVIIFTKLCCSEADNLDFRTLTGLLRRDRTSTTTSTTARSIINEKKFEEETKEIPIKEKQEKIEKPIEKAKDEGRFIVEDRTFGRNGLKNILLGGVVVAVINIAPIILSGLKTIVNLTLPILGLLLFRQHRSFRYFDDFMDLFEDYTNDNDDDDNDDAIEQDKEVITNDENNQPAYQYANYDYNYYNTNPYRAYEY